MAINKILADGVQPTVTTVEILYTSPLAGGGTRVIAFTAANTNGTTDTYDLHIVPNGGSADLTNKLVDSRPLTSKFSDVPAEIQNHLIPPGGTLEVKVSTGTTIAFRSTGIEF